VPLTEGRAAVERAIERAQEVHRDICAFLNAVEAMPVPPAPEAWPTAKAALEALLEEAAREAVGLDALLNPAPPAEGGGPCA
jgi:sugar phosphate isomerase/epimerase